MAWHSGRKGPITTQSRTLPLVERKEWHADGQKRAKQMGRILKALLVLVLLGLVGLTTYAYLADLSPAKGEVKVPVTLNAD